MKEIQLTQGKVALVDDDNYEYLNQWKWFAKVDKWGNWYAVRNTSRIFGKRKSIWMHRLIMNTPEGMMTDHISTGDTLNNQRSNLRICTGSQNKYNTYKQINNTSGYKGVSSHGKSGKWQAKIEFNGKAIHLGVFENIIDAAKAYDDKAVELFGDFARVNIK